MGQKALGGALGVSGKVSLHTKKGPRYDGPEKENRS